jgi:transposase-like protein
VLCDQKRLPNLNIFEVFRDLKVFKRNKKPFELKVLGTLDYIFSGSYRKIARKLTITFEPVSKSAVHRWVKAFTSRVAIALEPKKRLIVAVDETCLRVQGKEVWLWAAIDVETMEFVAYHVSLYRNGLECSAFLRKVLRMCTNKPLVLTDGGRWYEWPLRRLGLLRQRMTFGLRNRIEQLFKLIKDRTKQFYNNFGCNKGPPRWIVCVELFMKLYCFYYFMLR